MKEYEYLKNLFTKEDIQNYNNKSDNDDFDKDTLVITLKKEFNTFLLNSFLETKLHRSNNIEYLLNQVCLFFKNTINLDLVYNISNNKSFTLKTMNIVFNCNKDDINIHWIINDFEQEFEKVLLYILEIKQEIKSYTSDLKEYPYLHQYVNIIDYEVFLHYSNIDEDF